jgi:hypothetical protein
VAVTIDDDPAADDFIWQGRYLFFFPEEIEPLDVTGPLDITEPPRGAGAVDETGVPR